VIGTENVTKIINAVSTPDQGYRALSMAVIAQAAYDYRKYRLKRDKYLMESTERFFRGWLFEIFARGRIDGNYIADKLKNEPMSELKKHVYGMGGE